jgi:hypothetical protein
LARLKNVMRARFRRRLFPPVFPFEMPERADHTARIRLLRAIARMQNENRCELIMRFCLTNSHVMNEKF